MVVVWDLPHLVIKDPFGEFSGELLLSNQVERLFHVRYFFYGYLDAMLTKHHDGNVTRVTVKNGEAERMVELSIPLGIMGKLAQVTQTVGHSASSFRPGCTGESHAA
jgi:hypothetical protein